MTTPANSYVKQRHRAAFAQHVLTPVLIDEQTGISVWDLHREGTRVMKVQITFTPEGIAIQGDLVPGKRQGIFAASNLGYGLCWFKNDMNEGYLCEKFLPQRWQPSAAADSIASTLDDPELVEDYGLTEHVDALEDLVSALRGDSWTLSILTAAMEVAMPIFDEGMPGFDYDSDEAGWLCAIQQRFAALYAERVAEAA